MFRIVKNLSGPAPAFGGLYKHLRGSSYRCYPIGWLKSSEEEGPRRQVHCNLDFAPSGEDQTWTSSNEGPRPPARAHRRTSPARFASIRCPIHQSRGACPPPASRSSRERVPPGPCIRSVRRSSSRPAADGSRAEAAPLKKSGGVM